MKSTSIAMSVWVWCGKEDWLVLLGFRVRRKILHEQLEDEALACPLQRRHSFGTPLFKLDYCSLSMRPLATC
jgi:hypothetical protein